MTQLPAPVLDMIGGVVTHVHSDFPHNPECSGTQSITAATAVAESLGFDGIAFTEHTSDPKHPSTADTPRILTALTRQSAAVAGLCAVLDVTGSDVRVISGVEANIMPNGTLDVPSSELAKVADYIVASQHGGLGDAEKDPLAVAARLSTACIDYHVDALGHPSRYNDEVGVNWAEIFGVAATTGTAVESNFNLWYSYGPGRGRARVKNDDWYTKQTSFWDTWCQLLAQTGAPVVIGLDIHEAGMWPHVEPVENWSPTAADLQRFTDMHRSAGIQPAQVLNSSFDKFTEWLATPKLDRASLVNW